MNFNVDSFLKLPKIFSFSYLCLTLAKPLVKFNKNCNIIIKAEQKIEYLGQVLLAFVWHLTTLRIRMKDYIIQN